MKIKWINHASFIFEYNDIKLISDPWIEGLVFNNGWDLISKTKFNYNDFSEVTHLWFSHEHPDHFNPSNLKKIPKEIRNNIKVLYQETLDKKIISFCKNLGFKNTCELKNNDWVDIGNNIKVLCSISSWGDSWLCIKTKDVTILNLNDCVLNTNEKIYSLKKLIGNIDILMTQFSYANWAGNIEQKEFRKDLAKEKIQRIDKQIKILNPKYIIPFASFVWFCHEENYYMNHEINKISYIYEYLKENYNLEVIILYPDDIWEIIKTHNSKISLEKYEADYKKIYEKKSLVKSKFIPLYELYISAHSFLNNLIQSNKTYKLYSLPSTKIHLTDHNIFLEFSIISGLKQIKYSYNECDISLSSESLYYCFKNLWGGDTLNINGRFQIPENGNYNNFRKYFLIASLNNRGNYFDD